MTSTTLTNTVVSNGCKFVWLERFKMFSLSVAQGGKYEAPNEVLTQYSVVSDVARQAC